MRKTNRGAEGSTISGPMSPLVHLEKAHIYYLVFWRSEVSQSRIWGVRGSLPIQGLARLRKLPHRPLQPYLSGCPDAPCAGPSRTESTPPLPPLETHLPDPSPSGA